MYTFSFHFSPKHIFFLSSAERKKSLSSAAVASFFVSQKKAPLFLFWFLGIFM